MKLRIATTLMLLTGLLAANAEAGRFNIKKVVKQAPVYNQLVKKVKFAPPHGGPVQKLPPAFHPPGGGQPPVFCPPKPPVVCPPQPPVICPPKPPVICPPKPPVCPPQPPVICPPQPPVCPPQPPVCPPQPPVCPPQPPVCPPVNVPPHIDFCIEICNHAGAEVHFNFNDQGYVCLPCHGCKTFHGHTVHMPTIEYHNGHEVVRYELAPQGKYEFRWSSGVLQLFAL